MSNRVCPWWLGFLLASPLRRFLYSPEERLLSEIWKTMKEEGKLLIAEPKMHMPKTDFDKTISIARSVGFEVINDLAIRRSYAVLLGKKRDKNKS